ncbi:MAG: phosphate acyltransferase PlsX [Actinobacteria bacterium]|nr:phosphate acyltransferase PlsX [Actinomycetota bacterium]MCL6095351.1 phosphate acyltransferase PlsX [Actinomycetota bacterium]
MLTVAVDAMGGDHAPQAVVEGAVAAAGSGIPVVLVGDPTRLSNTGELEIIPASEVVEMTDDPAKAVRRKKDSSMVRAAEAVRDGKAAAMVSAGNTGAAMAAALLRMGRLAGVSRPAIATPLPVPGRSPCVLIDSGANLECSPTMLVQFAQMGSIFARERYGIAEPRVALLSIGEEPSKGTDTVRQAHALLAEGAGVRFIGNVEGRDLLGGAADVVVTDGFTGNVALKSLEGSLKSLMGLFWSVLQTNEETQKCIEVLMPYLTPILQTFDPDNTGGAMLLGVNGVCVISHGSSSATAITNAIKVAHDLAAAGLVDAIGTAVKVTGKSQS